MEAKQKKLRTGIFGGSFNPIHVGHVALADCLLRQGWVDEVWFVVSPLNPFKTGVDDLLPDHQRLEITQKALQGKDGMVASDYEFHLPKPSYTWHTLQRLANDYPQREFTLVIGADNWTAFHRWANTGYILANHPIVVYPREGCPIDPHTLPQGVSLLSMPLLPVSSTDIRKRVESHLPIDGLVPENVVELVERYYRKQP